MNEKPILLMQTGDAPAFIMERCGNFDRMFYDTAGLDAVATEKVHVARGGTPTAPDAYAGVIVTGSPDMVTDRLPWSEAAAEWLRRAVKQGLPVFAVCYGHQLLAHALGGKVGYLPGGEEVGTYDITLTDAAADIPLLAVTPKTFPASLAHSQAVLRAPRGAVALAYSERDPHQMLLYGPNIVSTQFHPEFVKDTTDAYTELFRRDKPEKAAFYDEMLAKNRATPVAENLLRTFVRLVTQGDL